MAQRNSDHGVVDGCHQHMEEGLHDMRFFMWIIAAALLISSANAAILFQENFEDTNFAARGWYDHLSGSVTTAEHVRGSTASFQCTYAQGGTTCQAGVPGRHLFTPSDIVYVSFWVKYSANFVGSGQSYHPHEFNMMTNKDDEYIGPACTHLTTYIEQTGGKPMLAIQDSLNVNDGCILQNSDPVTKCDSYPYGEDRSVASCNGIDGYLDLRDCWWFDSFWYSARAWYADDVYFKSEQGPYYKNDWHFIEALWKMNTISNGVGVPDGSIRYWYDGEPLISSDNILLRTGANADMLFNQLMTGMYIGDGSPVTQTMWVDNLTVSTTRMGYAEPNQTTTGNILNNPGFETGLQCYQNWVWSKSCPSCDYQGTYDFFLSRDAHSGNYSLEIRCTGSDCGLPGKAAISSNEIYSPNSKAYTLQVYAKCPSDGSGWIYLPSTSQGESIQELVCNGAWNLNEVTFSSPSSGNAISYAVYNTGTTSLFIDDVRLTYADGTVPVTPIQNLGHRNSRIQNNLVYVDDKPYLALGFFNVPYNDLDAAAAQGTNTVTALGDIPAAACFSTAQTSYLDEAYRLGINVVPDSTFTARLDEPNVFPSIIDQFTNHRAVIAWFLVDEPDQSGVAWYSIQPQTLINEYTKVKSATTIPVIADMQRTWETNAVQIMQSYAPAMDIWMAEPYGEDFTELRSAVSVMRQAQHKPVWLAQDAVASNLIVPKAYYAVVNNVTGILYFRWDSFKSDTARLNAAGQAFTELRNLSSVLFATDVTSSVSASQGIAYAARSYAGKTYIIAVNPTTQSITGQFSSSLITSGTSVQVLFEGRTITPSAGSFSDPFAATSRHVYMIDAGFCHEADNAPQNKVISVTELQAYINLWRQGQRQTSNLMGAIKKWKGGC
jgi:hypothetical protein